jgi:hypothetical protein
MRDIRLCFRRDNLFDCAPDHEINDEMRFRVFNVLLEV